MERATKRKRPHSRMSNEMVFYSPSMSEGIVTAIATGQFRLDLFRIPE